MTGEQSCTYAPECRTPTVKKEAIMQSINTMHQNQQRDLSKICWQGDLMNNEFIPQSLIFNKSGK